MIFGGGGFPEPLQIIFLRCCLRSLVNPVWFSRSDCCWPVQLHLPSPFKSLALGFQMRSFIPLTAALSSCSSFAPSCPFLPSALTAWGSFQAAQDGLCFSDCYSACRSRDLNSSFLCEWIHKHSTARAAAGEGKRRNIFKLYYMYVHL